MQVINAFNISARYEEYKNISTSFVKEVVDTGIKVA